MTLQPTDNFLKTPKQMSVDREGNVTDAGFVAKRTVLGVDGAPLTTRSGKLLISDCSCQTLRSLGWAKIPKIKHFVGFFFRCEKSLLKSLFRRMSVTLTGGPQRWRGGGFLILLAVGLRGFSNFMYYFVCNLCLPPMTFILLFIFSVQRILNATHFSSPYPQ